MYKPVQISLSEPKAPLGLCASRWWGNPVLPAGVDLPTDEEGEPLHFICQINLAEMPPVPDLPSKGLLQFYANIYYYLGWEMEPSISGYVCDPSEVRVLYFPDADPSKFHVEEVKDEDGDPAFPPEMAISFPEKLNGDEPELRLLGEADHREWEDWDHPYEGWRVLLQVDSFEGDDFNLMFMDCGVLDFIISPSALKKRDFSNVRGIVLSS